MDTNRSLAGPAGLIESLADNPALDAGVDLLDAVAGGLSALDALTAPLDIAAAATGAPLHPALVHLPIGGAVSAAVVDLLGMRVAAGTLTGFTAATAAASALAGLHDYAGLDDRRTKRVAFAHFAAALTGSALVTSSLVARTGGARGAARILLWGGCAAYGLAGLVGGHLVYGEPAEQDAARPGWDPEQETFE